MKHWRNSREYRIWRVLVIRRDKVCIICGSRKHRQAHHLDHASYFPAKRFDKDNGVCLCSKCHSIFHNKFIGSTRKKCTKKDFERFKVVLEYCKDKI